MSSGCTLNIRHNSENHISMSLISIIFTAKVTLSTTLIDDIAHDCRTLSDFNITIYQEREIREVKA